MIKLTPTQLTILQAACAEPEGLVVRPGTLKLGAAIKTATKLIEHGLAREVRAKGTMPIWREGEDEKPLSLKILKAGRMAVQEHLPDHGVELQVDRRTTKDQAGAVPSGETTAAKPGSKRALILGLLQRPEGASIEVLMAATGWLPHTTRAALSGLRKAGIAIERRRNPGEPASVYRIEALSEAA